MYRCRLLLSISIVAMLLMPANALAVTPVMDDFESYATGQVDAVTGGKWVGMGTNFTCANIEYDVGSSGNQVLGVRNTFGPTPPVGDGNGIGVYRHLSSGNGWQILPDTTETMSFKLQVTDIASTGYTTNHSIGLTNVDAPPATGDLSLFGFQLLMQGGGNIAIRDNTGGLKLSLLPNSATNVALMVGKWYTFWFDITNGSGTAPGSGTGNTLILGSDYTSNIYIQGDGTDPNIVNKTQLYKVSSTQTQFNFRNVMSDNLDTLVWKAWLPTAVGGYNPEVKMDDLSIPEPATMVLLGLGSLALLRRRKS